ncbi:hypothetical protein ACDX77_19190 [Bacillus velezensis]|uniref:hypothetical protein n=1 Tax=Bacillus amyloliquefaciens group TaxID=1938374 RepID=UPI000E27C4CB|nr:MULTISPECIES: hypothetical protein [Bacillus amyloliquefaciens group]RDY83103.1 hypothetical protein C3733_19760 [Bacillus amyloliquefaciens]WFP05457.1 hypothetical protein JEQ22_20325 [Bacillus velezensis]
MAMEDAAGEFTSQIIFMFIMYFLVALTIFGAQSIQTTDFKNYVDGQLESHGGLTANASANIEKYSKTHYEGRYSVVSNSASKKPYGETIEYEIRGKIKIFFMDLPDQLVSKRGSTISLVR